jgi:hypothetical protein
MVALGNSNGPVGFDRDVFGCYSHCGSVLVEFFACEVLSGIGNDHIGWSNVDIYPAKA